MTDDDLFDDRLKANLSEEQLGFLREVTPLFDKWKSVTAQVEVVIKKEMGGLVNATRICPPPPKWHSCP